MDGWWDEMDDEILEALAAGGPMDPVELARRLRMPAAALCSCLAMLAADGKIRIRSVEATPHARRLARAA